MEEIINDYEYPSLLADVKKTNYGYKEVIELWNAIDDESPTYEEYSQYDIARTIVYLINKVEELENNSIPKSKIKDLKKENEKRIDEMRPYKHQAPFDFGVLNGIDEACRKLLEDK